MTAKNPLLRMKEIKDDQLIIRITTKEKTTIKRYAKQKKISMSRFLITLGMDYIKRNPIKGKTTRREKIK